MPQRLLIDLLNLEYFNVKCRISSHVISFFTLMLTNYFRDQVSIRIDQQEHDGHVLSFRDS